MSSLFSVRDRHVLVTGASSGLGNHFAMLFADEGARVTVLARRADRLKGLVSEIKHRGGDAVALTCDVNDDDALRKAFDDAEKAHGPVQVLVNNAGITRPGPAVDIKRADWDAVMDTNLNAVWVSSQEMARRMIAQGTKGSIINIASIGGIRTFSMVTPYVVSKAGVIAMTRNLAIELAQKGVRVNAIAPGLFDTELGIEYRSNNPGRRESMMSRIPMARLGEYRELDGAVLLLASDASTYMTGEVIVVDGGYSQNSI
jgi:NAD(P)-dependent dehydrogenase (short-subunit alcohol dehydrogenase family)